MSGLSVNLTTLFLGRLRPPKQLTSTLCTYFCQQLTTAPLESAEGETKVCGQTGYRIQELWPTSQVPYQLHYAARPLLLKYFSYSVVLLVRMGIRDNWSYFSIKTFVLTPMLSSCFFFPPFLAKWWKIFCIFLFHFQDKEFPKWRCFSNMRLIVKGKNLLLGSGHVKVDFSWEGRQTRQWQIYFPWNCTHFS